MQEELINNPVMKKAIIFVKNNRKDLNASSFFLLNNSQFNKLVSYYIVMMSRQNANATPNDRLFKPLEKQIPVTKKEVKEIYSLYEVLDI